MDLETLAVLAFIVLVGAFYLRSEVKSLRRIIE
jgi:hypothetical protein